MENEKNWRRYLPNIGLRVELPFNTRFSIVTLYERQDALTVEWFRLDWNVYKWGGYFNLYYKVV